MTPTDSSEPKNFDHLSSEVSGNDPGQVPGNDQEQTIKRSKSNKSIISWFKSYFFPAHLQDGETIRQTIGTTKVIGKATAQENVSEKVAPLARKIYSSEEDNINEENERKIEGKVDTKSEIERDEAHEIKKQRKKAFKAFLTEDILIGTNLQKENERPQALTPIENTLSVDDLFRHAQLEGKTPSKTSDVQNKGESQIVDNADVGRSSISFFKLIKSPVEIFTDRLETPNTEVPASESSSTDQSIQMTFTDHEGKTFATQIAERFDTVPFIINSLETKIKALEAKKASILNDQKYIMKGKQSTEFDSIKKALTRAQNQLALYKESVKEKTTWVSVAAPQTLFKHSSSVEEAKSRYVPGLTNLRTQNVKNAKGEQISSINRSGALTDFSRGEISLQELQDYQNLVEFTSLSTDNSRKASLGMSLGSRYAITLKNQPHIDPDKLDALIKQIETEALAGYPNQISRTENGRLNIEELNAIIKDREELLSLQFLQDLSAHLENRPATGDPIILGRSSLVNMVKKDRLEGELVIRERTEAFDMNAIYRNMDGKTIKFDINETGKGYMDEEGIIHLPASLYKGKAPGEGIHLRSVFSNISVQGNIENTGMQKTINAAALEMLNILCDQCKNTEMKQKAVESMRALQQKLAKLEEYASWHPVAKFFKSPDPFEAALDFQKALEFLGGYGSANCYGGVDRTGYLVELKTHDALERELKKEENAPKGDKAATLLKRWGLEQLGDHAIAIRIGRENKGHRVFKLVRFALKLYATHTPEGVAKRINHLARGLFLLISGMEKQKTDDMPSKLDYEDRSFTQSPRIKENEKTT